MSDQILKISGELAAKHVISAVADFDELYKHSHNDASSPAARYGRFYQEELFQLNAQLHKDKVLPNIELVDQTDQLNIVGTYHGKDGKDTYFVIADSHTDASGKKHQVYLMDQDGKFIVASVNAHATSAADKFTFDPSKRLDSLPGTIVKGDPPPASPPKVDAPPASPPRLETTDGDHDLSKPDSQLSEADKTAKALLAPFGITKFHQEGQHITVLNDSDSKAIIQGWEVSLSKGATFNIDASDPKNVKLTNIKGLEVHWLGTHPVTEAVISRNDDGSTTIKTPRKNLTIPAATT